MVRRANTTGTIVETKTKAGETVVPLFATARAALVAHKLSSRFTDEHEVLAEQVMGSDLPPRRSV